MYYLNYVFVSLRIRDSHPDEAQLVMDRTAKLRKEWEDLNSMLHEREAKLEEAGDLHRFLKDLDHFQVRRTNVHNLNTSHLHQLACLQKISGSSKEN